jgi:hypothetical protein
MSPMSGTVIVWSLYVWFTTVPSYDMEHRPILDQATKLVGEYETQARCEEARDKQKHVARCIPREIDRQQ